MTTHIHLHFDGVPEMTAKKYAQLTGVADIPVRGKKPEETSDEEKANIVKNWLADGHLPKVKNGKHNLVNVVARTIELAEKHTHEQNQAT